MGNIVARRGVFVGRRDELESVSAALEDVRRSRSRILVIEGEAGVGKTAFVRQFLAGLDDVVALKASGDESETTLEYGVLSQLASRAPQWADRLAPGRRLQFPGPRSRRDRLGATRARCR
jgi:type II secretory pathway predicted ATPase ExeA